MTAANFIAVDLGAESGRTLSASFDGAHLSVTETHRFPNVPVRVRGSLYWDVLRLFDDIRRGLMHSARSSDGEVRGIGLDTWGVDFALLDRDDQLLGNPVHYRDERTRGMLDAAVAQVGRQSIFEQTGIQFIEINSLYQLYAMRRQNAAALEQAPTFLMMPDLFNFWLTGHKGCEFTNATTSQCYDPRARAWATPLLQALDIPTKMFPAIIPPGTVLGPLEHALATEVGLPHVTVVAPATHDTGSAVVAVPGVGSDFAWLSSGTWSILGAEVSAPVINAASLNFNFTNEGGVENTFRLCKNVMGLWLVQECRRAWARGGQEFSYADLVTLAEQAPAFRTLLDPDQPAFLRPGNMPAQIAEYAAATNQPIPDSPGAVVRCVLEGLALKYRFQLERLEALLGRTLKQIHIIGGGTQNTLLSAFTADATGKPVIAGPVEATAVGNVLMQLVALDELESLQQGRRLVRESFPLTTYEPRAQAAWQDAYGRFRELVEGETQ